MTVVELSSGDHSIICGMPHTELDKRRQIVARLMRSCYGVVPHGMSEYHDAAAVESYVFRDETRVCRERRIDELCKLFIVSQSHPIMAVTRGRVF